MPIHYYLPKLKGEKHITPPQKGCWGNQDGGIFTAISNAIEVAEKADDLHVSSIPDIWARPLVFQSALKKNSQHPLKDRYKNEWRGLLSLLALSKYKYDAVKVIPVELDDGRFARALKKLTPHNEGVQLEKDIHYLWTDILIIKYGDISIGAFSPTTLVYTATAYNDLLKTTNLDLKDKNGYLRPPSKGEENYELVGEWLEVLVSKLDPDGPVKQLYTNELNNDRDITGNILSLLKEWLQEIRNELDEREIDSAKVAVAASPLISDSILDKYHIYHALLCPLDKDVSTLKSDKGHSDISLIMKRHYSGYSEVVVITENLLKKKKRIWEPKDKGAINLDDFHDGDVKATIEKYFNKESDGEIKIHSGYNLRDEKAIWIRPEKYFLTDTLLKGKGGNLLMDAEKEYNAGQSGTKYFLPFKKQILDFFAPQDIKDLQPEYKEDGGDVTFSFLLPTNSGKEKIEKIYKLKGINAGNGTEGTISEMEVPVIEIFPNYLDANWRRYYVFNGSSENLSVSPVTFGRYEPTKIPYEETVGELKQKVEITEINADNAFPEGLEIKKTDQYAGLILLQVPKQLSLSGKWKVGVDFGTSNTNVYRQNSASDNAEKWSFDFPKYTRRITTSPDDVRERLMRDFFVPTNKIDLPIPTTLKIYSLANKHNLILDYFIFFPSEYKLPNDVYSDIKWDVEGERKTVYFIESIFFLILIEACNQRIEEIEVLCSYPKAFSPNDITILKGDWMEAFNKLLVEPTRIINSHESISDNEKIKIKGTLEDKKSADKRDEEEKDTIIPLFETEGKAAGEFFGSAKTVRPDEIANIQIAAICLDIGGGTSDISIWYGGKIRYDASVTLAGRQISRLFQRNRRLWELLFSKDAAIALEEKKNEPTFFAARLNLILRKEEKTIQAMLVKHANQKDVQWLRQMLAIEFCAISFYTAMLTAAADKEIGGGLLERIGKEAIGLHWGGNAAKFINWIDFGRADKNGIGSKMLSAAYYNCLKDVGVKPNALAHYQSPSHKSEASGGLVVMVMDALGSAEKQTNASENDMDDSGNKEKDEKNVCGEAIELSDKKIDFLDTISEKDYFDKNKTKFKSTTLEKLTRYVDILNFFGIKLGIFTEDTKINLNDTNKRNIRDKILSEFIKAQSLKERQRLIEPIFIMEVKVLLEILMNELR